MLLGRVEATDGVRFGSAFLICAGVTALTAWFFEWRTFLQILPDTPLMTCDAAVCFILLGLGFLCAIREHVRFSRVLGLLVALLGAVYLGTGLAHVWFSLHSLFPEFTARVVSPLPVRRCHMATATAVQLFSLGSLLVLIAPARPCRHYLNAAVLLAGGALSIGVLGILVYLAGMPDQQTWARYMVTMAFPSAVCSCVAGATACALFWMRTEISERRLSSLAAMLTFLGLLFLFAGISSALVSNSNLGVETRTQLDRVLRQISLIDETAASVRKIEMRQSGFPMTGNDSDWRLYEAELQDLHRELNALSTDSRTDRLRGLLNEELMALSASGRPRTIKRPLLAVGDHLALPEAIDGESAELNKELRAEFSERLLQNERSMRTLQKTVVVSFFIAALMVVPGLFFLQMEVRRRAAVEAKLRDSGRNLEERVKERTDEIRRYSEDLRDQIALRKLIASVLRQTSDELRLSLGLARVAVWTWHADVDRAVWSGAVEEVFGYPADQLNQYASFREMIVPEDRPAIDALLTKSLKEAVRFSGEFRITHPAGDVRWIAGYGDVLRDESGRVTRIAGVNLDISEKKRVERQLELSEKYFRELAESVPQLVWTANAQGEHEYQNERFLKVTGLPKGKLSAEDRRRVVHPEDFARLSASRDEAVLTGQEYDLEFRLFDVRKQEYRWQWVHNVPVRDASGVVIRRFAICTDIHERKVAQLRLAESERVLRKREEQLAMLFESGSIGDFTWDFAKAEISAHPAVWSLLGEQQKSGTAPLKWLLGRFHPDDSTRMTREAAAMFEGTKPLDAEARVIWPDGSIHWVASRGVLLRDNDGKPVQMHGLVFDVTERKLAAMKVEESERHFREMADAMPQIVWRAAPNGQMDYCNARWYEYSGLTYDETRRVGWEGIVHPEDFPACAATGAQGFTSGQPFQCEFRLRQASDGAYRWHLARSVPYRDLQGRVLHWFGAATDIHEQKLDKQLLEREVANRTSAMHELEVKEGQLVRSLAEKDTLVQEVHHRVKNNLQVISSLLRLQGEVLKDQAASAALKESHQRVLSMALIHEQLYGNQQMDQIDFADFARTLLAQLFRSYGGLENRVTYVLDSEPFHLQIDQAIPSGLILNELVTNALKYAYPKEQNGEVTISLNENNAGLVTLRVSDRGVGLPEGFDWTNSDSLGLPIVHLLTEQLSGTLTVQSDRGAAFTIEFPKASGKAKSASAA